MLTEQLIKTYGDILDKYRGVTFEDDECIYRIWESDETDGWEFDKMEISSVSLWDENLKNVICSDPWVPVDGGTILDCSARDMIRMVIV